MLMDEPFSAVDPVVRSELQDEFLRLQGELGKTIVFVTHDIDEAVKLGDQIAVLRVGGTLGQLADPQKLLSDPVDDFVAGFVGRDRGYRALAFRPAGDLPLHEEPTVPIGADGAAVQRIAQADGAGGWVLAVDGERRPAGWWTPACCTAAGRWLRPAGRCGPPWTPRCPRRPGAGCW
jgi:osmoprotectant transport system ATP-binding protein